MVMCMVMGGGTVGVKVKRIKIGINSPRLRRSRLQGSRLYLCSTQPSARFAGLCPSSTRRALWPLRIRGKHSIDTKLLQYKCSAADRAGDGVEEGGKAAGSGIWHINAAIKRFSCRSSLCIVSGWSEEKNGSQGHACYQLSRSLSESVLQQQR